MSTESLEAQLRNLQVSNRRSRAAAGRSNNGGTKESDIINHLMSALALGLRMKGGPITGRINKMERRPKNAFMRAREEVKNEMIAAGATAQEIRALQREVSREAANRASRRLRALNAEIQPDQTNQVERRPKNAFMRAREEVKNEMIAAGATAQQVRARQREISREAANRASRGRHASNIVVQPDHQHAGVSLVAASPSKFITYTAIQNEKRSTS